MGWGGMGTPLPHPSFISKFMIIFPLIWGGRENLFRDRKEQIKKKKKY